MNEVNLCTFDSTEGTKKHIETFQKYLAIIFMEISKRNEGHDASKLKSPEKETFDRVTPLLASLTYGSDEYKAVLDDMQEALVHHYAHNRHHPEFFKGTTISQEGQPDIVISSGMQGMTIVDAVEMFCDWCAATERHDDGDIGKSINHNMKRFGYGETMAHIMVNTAQEYGMGRRSHLACITESSTESQLKKRIEELEGEVGRLRDGVVERYSNDNSHEFWRQVGSLSDDAEVWGKIYSMGCNLQNLEHKVLEELAKALAEPGKD